MDCFGIPTELLRRLRMRSTRFTLDTCEASAAPPGQHHPLRRREDEQPGRRPQETWAGASTWFQVFGSNHGPAPDHGAPSPSPEAACSKNAGTGG